jgi:hypothetical protein
MVEPVSGKSIVLYSYLFGHTSSHYLASHVLCFMQIGLLGYPGIDLSRPQIDRCLEAYILWLFGKVMFTDNHVNTVDARYISIAREIADARYAHDIVPRSFGSAVLAATYRGMCKACLRRSETSALIGCPLLLQLWSYERFPIGRPNIYVEDPYDVRQMDANPIDLPTFGTVWTRRAVCFFIMTGTFYSMLTNLLLTTIFF